MADFVEFDYNIFITRYPEFSGLSSAYLQLLFSQAGLTLANDGSGPIQDPAQQTVLMNMLTAHIAELNRLTTGPDGNAHAVNQLVGRVDSATQGTVTLHAEYNAGDDPLSQWLAQTKYGAEYLAATAALRLFHYRPGPRRIFDPVYGGRPWYWRV